MGDPAIKLFGKTIPLPGMDDDVINQELPSSSPSSSVVVINNNDNNDVAPPPKEGDKGNPDGSTSVEESGVSLQASGESACQEPSGQTTDNPDALSDGNEKVASEPSKSEEEKTETSVSQDKTLKKPDKIIPCPWCSSMETKFWYYNNYNVNQPRHFGKKCQRYWTAVGTMRNVPVVALPPQG